MGKGKGNGIVILRVLRRGVGSALVPLLVGGCTQGEGARGACERPERIGQMPDELPESSGLAASRRYPGVFWSHNDSGHDPVVFAIDTAGKLLGRVRVSGARNVDWEDMELAPCATAGSGVGGGSGPGEDCLYFADTGDNRLRRDDAAIYRVPEPAPGDTATVPAERFPVRFPDGPRDVEALYILPDGAIHLVSKGRRHPIAVYRYPPPLRADERVELERVQTLSDGPALLPRQVTGAAASPDGRRVAIRTYTAVQLYHPAPDGRLTPLHPDPGIDLFRLAEPQGEAVELLDDGTLYFTSETGPQHVPAPLTRMRCRR